MNITSVNKKTTNDSLKRTSSKSSRILPNLNNQIDIYDYFSHERPFTNLKIILNHETIWCDKASLSAASPIIREQLLQTDKDESLVFNDIDLHDFLLMLEFIYPIFNPEMNERNISCLINLSYRFQFDMLQHACQIYVMKYLSTIRRVFNNYHNTKAEGDYFVSNNQHDLIQFHNRTCVDALKIIVNLCRWLKIYYKNDHKIIIQESKSIPLVAAFDNHIPVIVISVLQQISVDYLEQAMTIVNIDDDMKGYIYQQRAQYLEHVQNLIT